ncbi:Methylthioadenosine phosphorylase [Cantharellus anzutake]|uniref:Methylthioadenosine phosphorylase n=1 Tax=Cantharellus anzutake TaxID=1750568 RepID=UPI001903F719|nr:Methylthioadenosine phosphorylase [Cantharellus anzutake]KAF8341370.1 Methylthioadenosine phosphorylase [Cantharellus anzutake]
MSSITTTPKALVGVIGGSGLYKLNNLAPIEEVNPETPWGYPSSPITIAELPTGHRVAFLARHGTAHSISPSTVPSRANIAALRSLGIRAILAFSAVGSLREEIRPGDFIIPSQIIDRTKGIRKASFFDETSVVAHAMFGDPFDKELSNFVGPLVKEAIEGDGSAPEKQLHTDKTVVCMEGPQFSTRAESLMYRAWGGDIINMSVLPEAKLAREAELSYTLIATATDYDAWRAGYEPVTVAEVVKTLHDNAETSRKVIATILGHVHDVVERGTLLKSAEGAMRYSMVTPKNHQNPEDKLKLKFILPQYFS